MKDIKELLIKYYQKKFNLSQAEAKERAEEGSIEEISPSYFAHVLIGSGNVNYRNVYILNINELVLVRSEEKNKDGEWEAIIL